MTRFMDGKTEAQRSQVINTRPHSRRTAGPGREQGLHDPSRPRCLVILYFVLFFLLYSFFFFFLEGGHLFAQSEVSLHKISPLLGQLIINQWAYALDGFDVPRPSPQCHQH